MIVTPIHLYKTIKDDIQVICKMTQQSIINLMDIVLDEKNIYIDAVNAFNDTRVCLVYQDSLKNKIAEFEEIAYFYDTPANGSGNFSGNMVYQKAKAHVKVLADGQGADEVFGGYLPYAPYLRDLREQGGVVHLLGLSDDPSYTDDDFNDADHLGVKGAVKMTSTILGMLRQINNQ